MAHGVVMELTIASAWWSLKQELTNMKTVKEPVAYKGIDGKNNVNRAENPNNFHAKTKPQWYFWLSRLPGWPNSLLTAQKSPCAV